MSVYIKMLKTQELGRVTYLKGRGYWVDDETASALFRLFSAFRNEDEGETEEEAYQRFVENEGGQAA